MQVRWIGSEGQQALAPVLEDGLELWARPGDALGADGHEIVAGQRMVGVRAEAKALEELHGEKKELLQSKERKKLQNEQFTLIDILVFTCSARSFPRHALLPMLKGMNLSSGTNSPVSGLMNLSGLYILGSCQYSGSFMTWCRLAKMVVPAGTSWSPILSGAVAKRGTPRKVNDAWRRDS
jgi:hypothetical protein